MGTAAVINLSPFRRCMCLVFALVRGQMGSRIRYRASGTGVVCYLPEKRDIVLHRRHRWGQDVSVVGVWAAPSVALLLYRGRGSDVKAHLNIVCAYTLSYMVNTWYSEQRLTPPTDIGGRNPLSWVTSTSPVPRFWSTFVC